MARLICITSEVGMSRKNGTIQLTEKDGGRSALVPVVQTSEIFALYGAEPDGPLLSLLSQYAVPLHVFSGGKHLRSYLPASAVLSGKTVLEQVRHLEDGEKHWMLAREMLRGGARIRCMAARTLRPREKEEWESRYLDCLAEGYAAGLSGIRQILSEFGKIDGEFLEREKWEPGQLAYASGLARAVVLGSIPKLSLDPWIGILCSNGGIPPLAEDLFFIFSPLLVWMWPREDRPSPDRENLPDIFRKHLSRPSASNGSRLWSLRYLPVREGYAILSHFAAGRPYRCASRVGVDHYGD